MRTLSHTTILLFALPTVIGAQNNAFSLSELAQRAIEKSHKVQIQEATTQKARIDRAKAWNAYLPKVNMEASYTYLNAPLEYSDDMQKLLLSTQRLLIKEQAAIQTYALPSGNSSKVELGTPYEITASDGSTSLTPLGTLAAQNVKAIPPIQEQDFFKANVNAQILLFSGLKVPYSITAAKHQIAANELLTESEKNNLLLTVLTTYDQLAIIRQSQQVLDRTETALLSQKKLVDKSLANGLTISLNQQRIDIAIEQLNGKRIELDNAHKLVSLRLSDLTGLPYDSVSMIVPEMGMWPLLPETNISDNRPEIKALDEAIMATKFKQKSDLTEYVPKVVAFGKKELIKDNLTMLDPEWYVGVGLKWTLFDGLAAKQNASQTKIDQQILAHKRDEASELSNIKLQRDWLEVQKCNQLVATAQRQAELTKNVNKLSQRQFEEGLITFNDHLPTLSDVEKAELELIQQIARQRMASAEYLQSTGQLTIESLQN
ncbi:MAG: TolC family protein [Breznakibacter sp.]